MKMEFNPDGSIKLPEGMAKKKEDDEKIFQNEPCVRVIIDEISTVTPLTCELTIQASDKVNNFDKIEYIFETSKERSMNESGLSIKKITNREYVVKIVSGKDRCSWCENFRNGIERSMGVKVINWGSCFAYSSSRKY
jgi:hypothetical protein